MELAATLGLRAEQVRAVAGHAALLGCRPESGPRDVAGRVADVVTRFHELTDRNGLWRLTRAAACAALVREAGTRFDPDVVRAWLRLLDAPGARRPQ